MDFYPDILGARLGLDRIYLRDILWTESIGAGILNERKDIEAMIDKGGYS